MFRFESPMVAVVTLTLPPSPLPSPLISTHRFICNFQCSSFSLACPFTHSAVPLDAFFTRQQQRQKKSRFQFFTHSLRLISTHYITPHHYLLSFCLQSVARILLLRGRARFRSNHLKIYVKMITVVCLSKNLSGARANGWTLAICTC